MTFWTFEIEAPQLSRIWVTGPLSDQGAAKFGKSKLLFFLRIPIPCRVFFPSTNIDKGEQGLISSSRINSDL